LPGRQKYVRVNKNTFLGAGYDLSRLEETFTANRRRQRIYCTIRGQFYSLGLYGKYYNAFANAGIIKKRGTGKIERAKNPAALMPEYGQMSYELALMSRYSVRTHRDLIVLRHGLEEQLKAAEEGEAKTALNEAIEATRRIEARSIEKSEKRKGIKK
jgi:hypothetical protein